MGKKVNFKNSDSLELVRKLLDEAESTLNDSQRTTDDVGGELGEIMDKILKSESFGVGAAGVGLAAGALVGGGMVAGIGVLAAPAVILGGGAYAAANKVKQKKLIQEKEMLIQRIMLPHDRIIFKLEQEKDASIERINHLKLTLDMLMGVKRDMESDLDA